MIGSITRTFGSNVSFRRWATATTATATKTTTRALRNGGCRWGMTRNLASLPSSDAVMEDLVKTEIKDRHAVLTLDRPPVNSLSLEMCTAISSSLKTLENNNPKVQSVVIASSSPQTFCAGLDLTELYRPSPDRLTQFWTAFQQLFIDLYGSRLATICAIGGHAPAAGCMVALACDYRIMASDSDARTRTRTSPVIGLNESKFGIVAPPWLGQLMLRTIGFRKGEMALAQGTLYPPDDALHIGLVDQLVPSKAELMDECQRVAVEEWASIPPHARVSCKVLARKEFIDDLISKREEDLEYFCTFITKDEVQAGLGAYLKSLKKK